MEQNKIVATSATFIMPIKYALAGWQRFKYLKTIGRRDSKLTYQALLQNIGDLPYLCVAITLTQGDSGERNFLIPPNNRGRKLPLASLRKMPDE